jgi:hypothetical protein
MNGRLKALLVGGPMYDPLHTRIAEFEEIQGLSVETVVAPTPRPKRADRSRVRLRRRFLRPDLGAHQIRPEPDSVANPARRRPGR